MVHGRLVVLWMRVNFRHLESFSADRILAGPRNDIDALRIFADYGISDTMRGGQDPRVTDDTSAAELGTSRFRNISPGPWLSAMGCSQ